MPALSPTMELGNIVKWHKKVGDRVQSSELLADVETDKATVSWESLEEGFLAKILIGEGSEGIRINQLAAILAENEKDIAAFKDYQEEKQGAPAVGAQPATASGGGGGGGGGAEATAQPQTEAAAPDGTRVAASPKARKLASDLGLPISQFKGTGPGGRIIATDIEEQKAKLKEAATTTTMAAKPKEAKAEASASRPTPSSTTSEAKPAAALSEGEYVDVPHTNMRKTIAKRLLQSKTTIPHYYLSIDCNMEALIKLRAELNEKLESKLSINDFIIKASALSLRKVPEVNASWMDNAMRMYNYVDISVAVATDNGLITPVVKNADLKGLSAISANVKELAAKAKANKLQPEEFIGGTFTISNLGMFGIKSFAAIINPPQACILAVGTTQEQIVVNKKEGAEVSYTVNKFMNVTMSCDHRVVDGAIGARFLQAFKSFIEEPTTMLLYP